MIVGDCNVCINGKLPSYSATCVECGLSRKNYKPMTNADRIRAMTDEELADWLGVYCNAQTAQEVGKPCASGIGSCEECWLDWLRREVSTDG